MSRTLRAQQSIFKNYIIHETCACFHLLYYLPLFVRLQSRLNFHPLTVYTLIFRLVFLSLSFPLFVSLLVYLSFFCKPFTVSVTLIVSLFTYISFLLPYA